MALNYPVGEFSPTPIFVRYDHLEVKNFFFVIK